MKWNKSSKNLLKAAGLKNILNKNKRLLKYCLIVFFLFYCHFNISSQGMHIRFISQYHNLIVGEIKFPINGGQIFLRSDSALIFLSNNKEIFKNGDTVFIQSGNFVYKDYWFSYGKYNDFVIYHDNDTITKFIKFDLKDTAIFEHGDY